MPYLTPSRHSNLLGQINLNRSTWRQLPRSTTGKRAKGPAAAVYAQCQWAHDLLEEMLREHVTPTEGASPVAVTSPRVRPPRTPRASARNRRDD